MARWPGGQVLSASPTPAGFPLPCPAFSFPTLMSFRFSSLPPPQGPHLPTYLPTYSSSNKQTNKNPFPNPLLPSPDSRSLAYPAALHRSPSRPPHAHCTLDFRLPSAPNWLQLKSPTSFSLNARGPFIFLSLLAHVVH